MKSKRHRPVRNSRNEAARRRRQKHKRTSSIAKASSQRTGLSYEGICARLNHSQEAMWKRFKDYALSLAAISNLPEADTVALDALARAVFGFRYRALSKIERGQAEYFWVRSKIGYALRNLAAAYPVSVVRDGFIEFEKRYGYEPTCWIQLARFLGLNPRHVHNVWNQVRLELHRNSRTVQTSEEAGHSVPSMESPDEGNRTADPVLGWVHQALAQIRPADACLLILRDICDYDEQEVLSFLEQMRRFHARSGSSDYMEFLLDEFVCMRTRDWSAPWDSDLVKVRNRVSLAVRVLRARRNFIAVLALSGNILTQMQPASATLVILYAVCQYSAPQIMSFLERARRARVLGAGLDDLEVLLDAFVGAKAPGIGAPWDHHLLNFRTLHSLMRRVGVALQQLLALAMARERG